MNEQRFTLVTLVGHLGLGGTERQLFRVLTHLDPAEVVRHVVVFNDSPNFVMDEMLEERGIRVWAVPRDMKSAARRFLFVRNLLSKIKADVVHSWTFHDNPYAGIGGRLAGVPVRLGSLRNSLYMRGGKTLPPLAHRLSLRTVSAMFVNSPAILDELVAEGYPAGRIVYVPNCVEIGNGANAGALRNRLRDELGIPRDAAVAGMVANLKRVKNLPLFVDALAGARRQVPNAHGLLIGQTLDSEPGIREALLLQIRERGLEGRLTFAGFRKDVDDILPAMDVLCLTSHNEGMPNSVLEAMSAGLPVVATRVGAVPELIDDGTTGTIVSPGDADEFEAALRRILLDPGAGAAMGAAGRKKAAERFSCERISATYMDYYRRALTGNC
jgi:glycosyltransferase involved in cell wall biosynthesis